MGNGECFINLEIFRFKILLIAVVNEEIRRSLEVVGWMFDRKSETRKLQTKFSD